MKKRKIRAVIAQLESILEHPGFDRDNPCIKGQKLAYTYCIKLLNEAIEK